ncbi:MAG: septum site-determining protein MinC [Nitrospinota bacterium]|nr:MAG: septum site-determining protein MinC [Nitrospinota bacterium]
MGGEDHTLAGHVLGTRKETITFKGFRNGIHLILDGEAPFREIQQDLSDHLQKAGTFFAGAPITLHLGERVLQQEEFLLLQQMLADQAGITIAQVYCEHEEMKSFFRQYGLPLASSPGTEQEGELIRPRSRNKAMKNNALVVKQTLRSGQRVVAEENLVVIGDVNPGAEVIAGGDVIVFGTLRGIAHAGMPDNTAAVIIALNLQPTQLRIAHFIGRPPDRDSKREAVPEIARIMGEHIVIDTLEKKRKLP